jgi:hypothetical protein
LKSLFVKKALTSGFERVAILTFPPIVNKKITLTYTIGKEELPEISAENHLRGITTACLFYKLIKTLFLIFSVVLEIIQLGSKVRRNKVDYSKLQSLNILIFNPLIIG